MFRITCLFCAVLATVACSDAGNGKEPPPGPAEVDAPSGGDAGRAACGVNVYPCDGHGVQEGDVATNFEFMGYADPREHCDPHEGKALDLDSRQKIAFGDFYVPRTDCESGRRELLWVMVSAGWCGPCAKEVEAAQKEYASGAVDPRIAIINIVFETSKPGERVTDAFLRKWINAFELTMPTVMDPLFQMGKYFNRESTPFNMLVETRTMRIIHRQTGADPTTLRNKIEGFFR